MLSPSDLFSEICSDKRGVNSETLEQVLVLAVELAREGREGRKIGTIFTVGDAEAVLTHSRPLVLDPLQGHAAEAKRLADPNVRETLKELAQLDGAFVISDDGTALSAARYLYADTSGIDLPLGLGSRHMAAASITLRTGAVAVVVSESAVVRLFDDGELVGEVIPELWMMNRYRSQIEAPVAARSDEREQVAVLSKAE